jgi:hypothetical protein
MEHKKATICLLVCANFAAEITAAVKAENLREVQVVPFPCQCLQAPVKRRWTLEFLEKVCREHEYVEAVGGMCLHSLSLLKSSKPELNINGLDQCFYLLAGKTIVDHYLQQGAYLIGSGWLADWQQHLKPMGFDDAALADFFAESCSKLVLLDSGVLNGSERQLHRLAEVVKRPFETMPVGLDYLRLFLRKIVNRCHVLGLQEKMNGFCREAADYAMALDVIGSWTEVDREEAVIENMLRLFQQLFAADQVTYSDWDPFERSAARVFSMNAGGEFAEGAGLLPEKMNTEYEYLEQGFRLRIGGRENALGVIEIQRLALPQYRNYYLNLGPTLAKGCSLAMITARTRQEIMKLNTELEQKIVKIENQTR